MENAPRWRQGKERGRAFLPEAFRRASAIAPVKLSFTINTERIPSHRPTHSRIPLIGQPTANFLLLVDQQWLPETAKSDEQQERARAKTIRTARPQASNPVLRLTLTESNTSSSTLIALDRRERHYLTLRRNASANSTGPSLGGMKNWTTYQQAI